MLFIALPVFVLQLSGSPLIMAAVFALELLPTVLVGPLAGVLVDRADPWRLMAGVAVLQALLLLPLLLAAALATRLGAGAPQITGDGESPARRRSTAASSG